MPLLIRSALLWYAFVHPSRRRCGLLGVLDDRNYSASQSAVEVSMMEAFDFREVFGLFLRANFDPRAHSGGGFIILERAPQGASFPEDFGGNVFPIVFPHWKVAPSLSQPLFVPVKDMLNFSYLIYSIFRWLSFSHRLPVFAMHLPQSLLRLVWAYNYSATTILEHQIVHPK